MGKTNDSPIGAASEKERALEIAIAECDQKIEAALKGLPSKTDLEKLEIDVHVSEAIRPIAPDEARERREKVADKCAVIRQQIAEAKQEVDRARKALQIHLCEARSEIDRVSNAVANS